ncbi:44658_t:CDS:2, partial [Gigaspora margarita]
SVIYKMAELRDKLSKYIGFSPNEVHLPITEEDRQLFRKLIAEQKEITNIVMDEYQFLIHHGYNFKDEQICEKVLIEVPPTNISRKILAHIEKRFEGLPLAPVVIV